MKKIIVAIDGPSGAGKSTVAKLLAGRLGYVYIDTGAMYRAIGWKADRLGVEPVEGGPLRALCETTEVTLGYEDGRPAVYVDGKDVTGEIRTPRMSMMASAVSAQPSVRARLLELQREMGRKGGVVMDGRDIGTVVFPDAPVKFFLDAAVEVRAKRRHLELMEKGETAGLADTLAEMKKRDHDDSSRDIAPLKKADDAIYLDTAGMGIDEVVALLVTKVEEAAARAGE
ncbi:MAG TPA: (d)CMP kinase [Nitrospirota bacterium]